MFCLLLTFLSFRFWKLHSSLILTFIIKYNYLSDTFLTTPLKFKEDEEALEKNDLKWHKLV